KAVDAPSFLVGAEEDARNFAPEVGDERPQLPLGRHVAGEQDDPARRRAPKDPAFFFREPRSRDADDEVPGRLQRRTRSWSVAMSESAATGVSWPISTARSFSSTSSSWPEKSE